jgi:uncharacterized protein YecT (DUF1311 family)
MAITAIAAVWAAWSAAADESPGATEWRAKARPMIEACIAKAQTIETMRQCKRIVFTPCYQHEDYRQSTHGLVMCNSHEGEAWQAMLDARTAELAKRDAYRAEPLAAANKAWRAWIEAECFFHRAEAQGGSAEGVITTECLSDLTADRVISLTLQLRGNLPY